MRAAERGTAVLREVLPNERRTGRRTYRAADQGVRWRHFVLDGRASRRRADP